MGLITTYGHNAFMKLISICLSAR